jgi:hypothetical protein
MLSSGEVSLQQRLQARKPQILRAAVAPATRGDFPPHEKVNRTPPGFLPED